MKKKGKRKSRKKEASCLDHLREMVNEHFTSLSRPDNKGCLHTSVYISDYEHLGYTLEAILNICIIGLDGYDERNESRYIKEPHKQFADVLEFAKNLIPHEELEFLDKSQSVLMGDTVDIKDAILGTRS